MPSINYDIIIIGAGCAGMQLMHALINNSFYQNQSILLLDDGKSVNLNKSWCFWHKNNSAMAYKTLISKQWHELTIGLNGSSLTKSIAPYTYSYIKSEDFFDLHFNTIACHQQIHYKEENVLHTSRSDNGFNVSTNKSSYHAKQVFSSSWSSQDLTQNTFINLQQQFYGWVIETAEPVFNDNAATLMDFNVKQHKSVNFVYILPFSSKHALVEITGFSTSTYDVEYYEKLLSDYIQKHWSVPFNIQKKEQAIIPMTDFPFSRYNADGAISIGTAAGMVKPTTGYAFNRIMRDSNILANAYFHHHKPEDFSPSRFRFYDRLLLELIQRQPSKAGQILQDLFRKASYSQVLRFLDEDSNVWQEAKLFYNLPKKEFLQTIPSLWKRPHQKASPFIVH